MISRLRLEREPRWSEFSDSEVKEIKRGRGKVWIWDVNNSQPIPIPGSQGAVVASISWKNDDTRLASANENGEIKIWDMELLTSTTLGLNLLTLTDHQTSVLSLGWSANGLTLVAADALGSIRSWDTTAAFRQELSAEMNRSLDETKPDDLRRRAEFLAISPGQKQ